MVLLLLAVSCLRAAGVSTEHTEPVLLAPRPPLSSATPSTPAAARGPAASIVDRSPPLTLRIPAISVSVPVSSLGLNPDHTVQVPTNFQQPGWYRLGPAPGQLGSAVILGHVDSDHGPAVFFLLRTLRPGDLVDVTLANRVVTHFAVTAVATYPKDHFPAQQVYGSHGQAALQLVTCGGTFDTHTHSYQSNIVAYTSLTTTTPAPATPRTTTR